MIQSLLQWIMNPRLYCPVMLCKLFANKKGFQFLNSETLVIPVSPAGLEPATH
jgi:hypothetical protein